jgi:Raf kinase inhibitor-like YbhB/YbcL family protein
VVPSLGSGGGNTGGNGESPQPGSAGESGGAALGGGGAGASETSGAAGSAGAGGTANSAEFVLGSSDFADGAMIPDEFTCDGKAFGDGMSPQLEWSAAPPDALSFAITFIDTTLTSKTPPDTNGYHWAMWDIPSTVMELPGGLPSGATLNDPAGAKQYSPFNPPAYLGPCPSFFEPATDEYAFVLYALDVETLPNPPNNVQELEQLFLDHAIATATLTGTSDAMPQ